MRLDIVPRTETSALFHLLDDGDGEATNLLKKSIGVGEFFGDKRIENLVVVLNPSVTITVVVVYRRKFSVVIYRRTQLAARCF